MKIEISKHRGMSSRSGGFTLIELLIVIAIIAVLIAILLPAMGYVKAQSKKASTLVLLNSLSTAIEQYYSELNQYPPSQNVGNVMGSPPLNRGSLMLAEGLTGYLNGPPFGFRVNGGGHVYGPYAPPTGASWKVLDSTGNTQVFVDLWGNEILYYRAVPAVLGGQTRANVTQVFTSLGSSSTPPGASFTGIFNLDDNSAIGDPSSSPAAFFKLLNASGNTINTGDNVLGKNSYLLKSAGPDGKYFTSDDIVLGGK